MYGEIYSFGCALTWAVGTIFFKKCTETAHPLLMVLYECLFSLVFFLPLLFWFEGNLLPQVPRQDFVFLFLSAVCGIVLGGALYFKCLQLIGASNTAIVECLYAPFVVGLSVLFLAETLTSLQALGAALVTMALVLISYERNKTKFPKKILLQGLLVGCLCQLCLAVSVVLMKPVLNEVPVLWVVPFRIISATLVLSPLLILWGRKRKLDRQMNTRFFFLGSLFCSCLAPFLWIKGMTYIDASVSAVILQLSTVLTVIFASWFLQEPLSQKKVMATAVAFFGVFLVVL